MIFARERGHSGTIRDNSGGQVVPSPVTVDSKDRTFLVAKDNKIVGPRGAVSTERLKDDRLAKGNEVRITLAADGKTAKQIKLPYRKQNAGKDKGTKDKPNDK